MRFPTLSRPAAAGAATCLLCLWRLWVPGTVCGDDWPAWRGPERTGLCRETGLLRSWPDGGPRLLWKVGELGEGFSTPAVAGNLILLMSNQKNQEWVFALDRNAEGKLVWATPIGAVRHGGGGFPGPRSTPTVDGNMVYALGLNGDLVCLNLRNGRGIWKANLVAQFGGKVPNWGYSESVLVDGSWVLCTPGGDRATMLALSKSNGRPVWQASVGDGAAYSSIIKVEVDGVKQYVQFTAQGVIGVDGRSGNFLWRYDAPSNDTANVSTPLSWDHSVFAASGYGSGGGLVQINRTPRGFDAQQKYFTRSMKNHHGGVIHVDGYLYGSDEQVLTCLDAATGEVKWQDRSCGKSSLLYADGNLIARSERGMVSLVAATPEEFLLQGRFDQPDRSQQSSWSHPVIAHGRLYLRDQDKLFCYDVSQ